MIDKRQLEIEKLKQNNNNFTQKEILIYLMDKIDKIDDNFKNQYMICNKNFISRKTVMFIFGIILTLIGGLAGIIFTHVGLGF